MGLSIAGPDTKKHPVYSQVPKQDTPVNFTKHKLSAALDGGGGGPITSRSVHERRAGGDDVSKSISFVDENDVPNVGSRFQPMMPQASTISINSTMLHQSDMGNDSMINLSMDQSFRPSSA